MKLFRLIVLFAVFSLCATHAGAYNIRQISSRDGLSNSAVYMLFQDKERFLWIGTYDGLNKYDGADLQIYKPDLKDEGSLSGNVIRGIVESKDDYLWIMTKGGLNKYSKSKDKVEAYFHDFQEDCSMACDGQGDFFILTQTGLLFFYDFNAQEFMEITIPDFKPTSSWINLKIDQNDIVWITNNGVVRKYKINRTDTVTPQLEWVGFFDHEQAITHIFQDQDMLILIDSKGDLFIVNTHEKIFIKNIMPIIIEYGDINSIVLDNKDIVIGSRTSGVVKLNHKKAYEIERIAINCGVFSLLKDDVQDILWIGTDGQGVFAYTQDGFVFKGINLDELPLNTQRPIRAIFVDHLGQLWLGTKGNGIIKIQDYQNNHEYNWQNVEHLSTEEGLSNNAVFTFEMSRRNNVLWIGSSGPNLNYYSYEKNKIYTLKTKKSVAFIEVHSILETSDTVLWVSSMSSLFKVKTHKIGNSIEATSVQEYNFDVVNKDVFNKIYAIQQENDSIMWLAMRGNGAIRFNNINGSYRLITFDKNGIAPMNDILSIHIDSYQNIWLGSSYGISNLKELENRKFQKLNYNENDGLLNNTIHGILEGDNGKLWLSSNTGIVLFDPKKKTFRNFNQKSGLKVIEFSDNAYFKNEEDSTYFFGGIDGIVWVKQEDRESNKFIPPIYFTKLRIQNEETNINNYLIDKKNKRYLRLKHNQNFFTVSFSVNDFIPDNNRNFAYKLEDFNDVWINTNSGQAQFTKLPPGRYVLRVKYGDELVEGSQTASLNIEILPPWFLSIYAKVFYSILIISITVLIYLYLNKKYEKKRIMLAQEFEQKHKEEMYENKLRFFTNVTHEFCTPLTLIHTPSERILSYEGSDSYIKKYAQTIRSNTERLNNLIQEIIDFRRMETGNKICKIERCNVNEICSKITEAFADMAEENNIDFSLNIGDVVMWNSDYNCLSTILNNLVSNAFKYTPRNGTIEINVSIQEDQLVLEVYNSGKGIREEDIPHVFNRYAVLDNVKQNSIKGLSSRNGLGLAICKSMVELLQGKIEIESQVDKYAKFIVMLPEHELSLVKTIHLDKNASGLSDDNADIGGYVVDNKVEKESLHGLENRQTVLIIDDNEEILWMLKEILSEEYNIITARDGSEGLEQLTKNLPDLVITDIMMDNVDGISMTKQIKTNPYTMHVPLIIISAKSAIDDKIEGIESGADAYISKPFSIEYLKTVARKLIEKHRKLREYYKSVASSFDYVNGQLLPKEDRDFIQAVIQSIEQNICDEEFSPEDLAEELCVSLRSLYRRFKDLDLLPPKEFIKKQRIEYSAKLLVSTKLTVKEIMYNAGFTTRSHFYKEFTKFYNMSPKEYREQENSVF